MITVEARTAIVARYVAGESSTKLAIGAGVTSQTILRWVKLAGERVRTKREARRLTAGDASERFSAKYTVAASGCWEWVAGTNKDGYAMFRAPNGNVRGHTFSYEQRFGPVPEGLELDHICRNRSCVNPDHLEPVTHLENMARAVYHNAVKVECKHGHPFDDSNTCYRSDGRRYCKECSRADGRKAIAENPERKREYSRRYYWRNREAEAMRHKEWRERNREHLNEYQRKRRIGMKQC